MRPALAFRPLPAMMLLLSTLAACTNGQDANTVRHPTEGSVYDRIGGKTALAGVVDDFMATVGSDPRIARRFANVADPNFKAGLVEELCTATGGPCHYAGPSMKDTHAALDVTDAEFNAMIQDLRHSMDRQGIAVDTQVAFAAAMEPLRDEIVSPLPPTTTVVSIPVGHTSGGHGGHYYRTSSHRPEPHGRGGVTHAASHHPASTATTHHPAAATHHPATTTPRKKPPSATNH